MPHRSTFRFDAIVLACLVVCIQTAMALYIYSLHLTIYLVDQSAHLNFARLTFDSLTPGVSQIGFWPPLIHFIMIPFVASDFLYRTGLAGFLALLPFMILGAWFLFRICQELTGSRLLGYAAVALLFLNPYFVYYGATPMMEALFTANLFGVAYFMLRWLETSDIKQLIGAGVFVTLACLSRFEGFMLLPVCGLIILLQLLRQRKGYEEIEAVSLLFGLLAVGGVVFVLVYSWIFSGNPLTFAGGSWLHDPVTNLSLTRYQLWTSLQYLLHASGYMIGQPFMLIGALSAVLLLIFSPRRFAQSAVLLILISPIFFILLTVFTGSIPVNVPELPPYGFFHNDRYTLTWIGFAILAPLLLIHLAYAMRTRKEWSWKFLMHPASVLLAVLLALGAYRFSVIAFAEQYEVVRMNVNVPKAEDVEAANFLHRNYDGGTILSARVDNDPILAKAGIPLSRYVYEGNYIYFDQVLKEPWLFARWVIMANPDQSGDNWAVQNEPVYHALGRSSDFARFYTIVYQNKERKIYKINDGYATTIATQLAYKKEAMPSLNSSIVTWNPSTIYADIEGREYADPNILVASKPLVWNKLVDVYRNTLQKDYARGYFVDGQGKGNSESQAYALMQSLEANDPQTFQNVWQWTKANLQRPDALFSWNFSATKLGDISIDDPNSATDADTDIAYTLASAGSIWDKPDYTQEALPIIHSVWQKETAEDRKGNRHVIAGNWANESGTLVMNPSYFSPAAYRLFQQVDPGDDWNQIIRTGYDDLEKVSTGLRSHDPAIFLPPNWVALDLKTGRFGPFAGKPESYDYSYDAFRVFWRIAVDDTVYPNPDAKQYLAKARVFAEEWQKSGQVCTAFFFAAKTENCQFDQGMLTGPLSVWMKTDANTAKEALRKLYFENGSLNVASATPFYEKSWYWFGLLLWTKQTA